MSLRCGVKYRSNGRCDCSLLRRQEILKRDAEEVTYFERVQAYRHKLFYDP